MDLNREAFSQHAPSRVSKWEADRGIAELLRSGYDVNTRSIADVLRYFVKGQSERLGFIEEAISKRFKIGNELIKRLAVLLQEIGCKLHHEDRPVASHHKGGARQNIAFVPVNVHLNESDRRVAPFSKEFIYAFRGDTVRCHRLTEVLVVTIGTTLQRPA